MNSTTAFACDGPWFLLLDCIGLEAHLDLSAPNWNYRPSQTRVLKWPRKPILGFKGRHTDCSQTSRLVKPRPIHILKFESLSKTQRPALASQAKMD